MGEKDGVSSGVFGGQEKAQAFWEFCHGCSLPGEEDGRWRYMNFRSSSIKSITNPRGGTNLWHPWWMLNIEDVLEIAEVGKLTIISIPPPGRGAAGETETHL